MAPSKSGKAESPRPRPLHVSRSFSQIEPPKPESPIRSKRASTLPRGIVPEITPQQEVLANVPRTFSDMDDFENTDEGNEASIEVEELSSRALSDELPIELISLTDSFIDSLSAKVHPLPPDADKLSMLFQDFYTLAGNHINTHISALSLRQHRKSSPSPSTSSRSSTASIIRMKAASIGNKERPKPPLERADSAQQMLTSEELAERKAARKALEQKRVALEEAIERIVCDKVYERIWRHRSTQDEAQDEKLRSKTAALAVVGIGLADLGIDVDHDDSESVTPVGEREKEVREWLDGARQELLSMNSERYPLGKLQHLKAAHKSIVDTLSHFHPSSSADEIMPMLIYTLITSPPEGINVISDLLFIQRFRSESKLDGEAAYCLTNLEAAITFLETVDLASLRADEVLSGPPKAGSRSSTPRLAEEVGGIDSAILFPSLSAPSISPAVVSLNSTYSIPSRSSASLTPLRPALEAQNRRLSDLFQPPAQALGAAGDAVLNTAEGFKTIGDSLGSSFSFLLGKLKERQGVDGREVDIVVPKTLDEARKLVGTPPPDDYMSASGTSSLHNPEASGKLDGNAPNTTGRALEVPRDRSVESVRSTGSVKKVAFAHDGKEREYSPPSAATTTSANPAIVESMRNLGNTLNPMTRIAGMGMMRGFGRSTPASADTTSPRTPGSSVPDGGATDLTTASPELTQSLPPKETPAKIEPPIKRFMEVRNPGELRINEVLELLRDYRRLAGALKDLGAV